MSRRGSGAVCHFGPRCATGNSARLDTINEGSRPGDVERARTCRRHRRLKLRFALLEPAPPGDRPSLPGPETQAVSAIAAKMAFREIGRARRARLCPSRVLIGLARRLAFPGSCEGEAGAVRS